MKKTTAWKTRTLIIFSAILLFFSAAVVPAAGGEMLIYQDPRYVEDEGTVGNRAVIHGAEQVEPEVDSVYDGWALRFDGESDWVDISSDSEAYKTGSFTVSIWARTSGENLMVLTADYAEGEERYMLKMTSGNVRFIIRGEDGSGERLSIRGDFSDWHHITASYDSETGVQSLYVNGEMASSRERDIVLARGGDAHTIGKRRPDDPAWLTYEYSRLFKGYVGLTQYYDSALSEDEVSALYEGENIETVPISSWSMEGVAPSGFSEAIFYVYPIVLVISLVTIVHYSYSKFKDKYDLEVK